MKRLIEEIEAMSVHDVEHLLLDGLADTEDGKYNAAVLLLVDTATLGDNELVLTLITHCGLNTIELVSVLRGASDQVLREFRDNQEGQD